MIIIIIIIILLLLLLTIIIIVIINITIFFNMMFPTKLQSHIINALQICLPVWNIAKSMNANCYIAKCTINSNIWNPLVHLLGQAREMR